jgi:hypothetical protein
VRKIFYSSDCSEIADGNGGFMIGLLKKIAWPLASLPALGAMIALTAHAADELAKPDAFDARRPPAAELEMSVADGFTLAAVGDCIISRPLSPKLANDTAFAAAIAVLRSSDATFGNLETSILDVRHFDGHPNVGADDWGLSSLPAVAGDLAEFGFDLRAPRACAKPADGLTRRVSCTPA